MADTTKSDLEQEIWNAISAFEQILEAMPNDRASLEALAHAYQQVGDLTQARKYVIRLAEATLQEGDFSSADALVSSLREAAADDEHVADLVQQLEAGLEQHVATETMTGAAVAGGAVDEDIGDFNLADEISMAWALMEANELTSEEYASVVQDLTEMCTNDAEDCISVLHVLENRAYKGLERVAGYLSRHGHAPLITLHAFETQLGTLQLLPPRFVIRRGVFCFEQVGKHVLVAVLNPLNEQLRKDVEKVLGVPCHFFVCLPSEFDGAVSRMQTMLEEAANAASS